MIKPIPKIQYINGELVEFSIYPLVDKYDPILKTPAEPYDYGTSKPNSQNLGLSLVQTMVKHGGLSLAAPQIGLPYRVFVMGADAESSFMCFNPVIVEPLGEPEKHDETCVSFPHLRLKVSRHPEIIIEYFTAEGNKARDRFTGLTARLVQHCMDYLNGMPWIDRVPKVALKQAQERARKRS